MNSGEENETWRVDTYVREVRHSNGNGVIAPHTPFQELVNYSTPPWNELVIYEIHVGTFNEDPHGPDHRGTFRSIIPELPYLKDLGINAIQLLPANEFAMDISLGYNPAHLFAIETSYGGPNGLREFVEAAHQDGIAVIFDVVYNLKEGKYDIRYGSINHYLSQFLHLCLGRAEGRPEEKFRQVTMVFAGLAHWKLECCLRWDTQLKKPLIFYGDYTGTPGALGGQNRPLILQTPAIGPVGGDKFSKNPPHSRWIEINKRGAMVAAKVYP